MNFSITRLLLACAVGFALVTTACTAESVAGSPQSKSTIGASPFASTSVKSSSPSPTSANAPENKSLAELNPCDLLTEEEVGSLGLTYPGKADRVAGADKCLWSISGNGNVAAAILPEQGFGDLNYQGDHTVPAKIGEFEATRSKHR